MTAESESEFEREQEDAAAADAGAIGGRVSSEPPGEDEELDPAQRPLAEAGQGESEGFEEAERELQEHATHGDEHAARRVIEDSASFAAEDDDARGTAAGEADDERTSEGDDR
ncbi:MAG: hypothetical protein WAK93_13180 [Solirubrobacteraceae bacterium]